MGQGFSVDASELQDGSQSVAGLRVEHPDQQRGEVHQR